MTRTSLPHFKELVSSNNPRPLKSVYPYVTAPAWASIFSGVNPGKHGIFEMFEVRGPRESPSNMRRSSTPYLWDYVSWAGKQVLVMGVPFVYPAPKINGVFVTGRFVPELSCYPSGLEESTDITGYRYEDIDTETKIELMISEGARAASSRQLLDLRRRISASLELLDSRKWDVAILVDSLPDEVFHFSYDDDTIVNEMFQLLDEWLGKIMSRMTEKDTLLIVSDHGFTEIKKVLFINEWLNDRGYLRIPQSILSRSLRSMKLDLSALEGNPQLMSLYGFLSKRLPLLSRSIKNNMRDQLMLPNRFQRSGQVEAFGINEPVAWLRVRDDSVMQQLLVDLEALKSAGLIKTVIRVDQFYTGKYLIDAPGQILIESNDGWAVDSIRLNNGRLVGRPLLTKKGVHSLCGIFAVKGEHTATARLPGVYDVVPTVLHLMKLPIPRYVDGMPLLDVDQERRLDWLDVPERL